jgi:PPOX class probable F420-dependent enzyme
MDQLQPDVRAFLDEQRFAVLATLDADGSPQQSVMWYQIEEDHLMMNTARGRVKDRNLRRDPRASVCIEDGYRFVTLAGTIEQIEDQEIAQADIVRLAMRYHGPEKGKAMTPDFAKQQRVTLRLTIRHIITNGFE